MAAGPTVTSTMPSYTDPAVDGGRWAAMTNSISSVVSNPTSSRQQVSVIAKSYRQAVQLYLTRRLPEALSTIEPVITAEQGSQDQSSGDTSGEEAERKRVAPVAHASRGTRIKVWSFYLTFLNAVVELGPEEGKHTFGSTKWKALVAKARDGTVWEDVVRDGYGGVEGDVDADVVVNLATLILTHAPSQKLNQTRLENYLSATSNPTFSISSSQLSSPPLHRRLSNSSHHGTSTPRDLNTRLKLIELYTLHILPKNQEWEYAREFIMMSEVLDDERKDAFLQGLHHLREESEQSEQRERELIQEREQQLEARRRQEEELRKEEQERERERQRREEEERKRPPNRRQTNGGTTARPAEVPGPTDHGRRLASPPSRTSPNQRGARTPAKKVAAAPQSLYTRASALLATVQAAIIGTAQGVRRNPMAYMRAMLFLLAFILAFAREEVRERVKAWLRDAWDRVRRTVGMGVKVSYI